MVRRGVLYQDFETRILAGFQGGVKGASVWLSFSRERPENGDPEFPASQPLNQK